MTVSAPRSQSVEFRRFSAAEAHSMATDVRRIYVASYVDAIKSGDPFDSVDAFMHRFDSYTSSPTFDLVIAYEQANPIGQTWGWPLSAQATTTGWWAGLIEEPEPDFTREDGHRTFALSEIMVRQEFAGLGVAHALHDQLLSARHEERATLLVEPENTTARRAYLHWGWRHVAQLRPGWDHAPTFDVFVLPLPLRGSHAVPRVTIAAQS
jgi:hypothetical protein